jgi:hypothetical protein
MLLFKLREDASGPYGWEGLDSGYYASALWSNQSCGTVPPSFSERSSHP